MIFEDETPLGSLSNLSHVMLPEFNYSVGSVTVQAIKFTFA